MSTVAVSALAEGLCFGLLSLCFMLSLCFIFLSLPRNCLCKKCRILELENRHSKHNNPMNLRFYLRTAVN